MSNRTKLFDSHCHLDFPQFKGQVNQLLEKCIETGIEGILIPGVQRSGWRRIRQIVARSQICYTALGLHPMFMQAHQRSDLQDLEMALSVGPVSAVGEIGLDYYKSDVNREEQLEYFKVQVQIAKEANLPIVMHVRKAHDEALFVLKLLKFQHGGTVHAFNGSEQQANQYIDMGFKLGFGGAMTYERAAKLHRLAKNLPLESLVLETDAPDMPPKTCQNSYNTPLHLFDNFRFLVSLREESALTIANQLFLNTQEVIK